MDRDEIIKKALDIVERILEKPDVPNSEIYKVMNQLSSYRATLLAMNFGKDRKEQNEIKEVCRGIDGVISTLKYQAKEHERLMDAARFNKL